MNLTQTTSGGETPEAVEAHRFRWQLAIRRECFRWANEPDQCPHCGERIGHFGGGTERDPLPADPGELSARGSPADVPHGAASLDR